MQTAGFVAAAIGGALIGWLLCAVILRRPDRGPDPALVAGPRLAAAAITHSPHGYAVVDAAGNVLLANEAARTLGVVRAGMLDNRFVAAVGRAEVSGEPVDVDLTLGESMSDRPGPRRTAAVHAVVQSIDDDLLLISASDESAAQRVEAVRRDFVANVSHELKTPVSAIVLLAEAVMDGSDDPDAVRTFAGSLIRESNRLGTLVSELIALSRLQGAEPLTDLAVVEVDTVVADAVARAAGPAERAAISVTTDQPSGLLVHGDRTLLVTAVANLIENAVNYSADGSAVSVSRRLRPAEPVTDPAAHAAPGPVSGVDLVEIAVTDRGIGIAPELQERVFERFFRIDPARSRATGGTGLGLAIVKHVAANHGGVATVWSRPGTGSTFTIAVPAVPASVQESAMPAAPAPQQRSTAPLLPTTSPSAAHARRTDTVRGAT